MSNLKIHISNFRAIEDAQIALNGITVLTGLNATGKSTIGRMMYYTGHFANHYHQLIDGILGRKMEGLTLYLRQNFELLSDTQKMEFLLNGYFTFQEIVTEEVAIKSIESIENHYINGAQVKSLYRERLGKVLGKQLRDRRSFFSALNDLKKLVTDIYADYNKDLKERPPHYLRDKLNQLFNTSKESLMKSLIVKEGDEEIISPNRKNIGVFTSLDSVFYMDTPMIANFPGKLPSGILDQNWEELIRLFYDGNTIALDSEGEQMVSLLNEVIQGTIELPARDQEGTMRNRKILFKDNIGNSYPLKEVATGIKSFSLLQSLLTKGRLNDKTLLIIDEPEAHLHPQWVVEYARMVTLLNQKLGVRFLIATHSPRLVQTLDLLANDKETNKESPLKFYLSEKAEPEKQGYRFRELTAEEGIEPIFECFNTAYDLINDYIGE